MGVCCCVRIGYALIRCFVYETLYIRVPGEHLDPEFGCRHDSDDMMMWIL